MSTADLDHLEVKLTTGDPNMSTTDSSSESSEDDYNEGKTDYKCGCMSVIQSLLLSQRREPQIYGGLMAINCNGKIDNNHWSRKKSRSNNMEYVKFKSVVDLDVSGSIPMTKLHPNKTYKGVFVVKLAKDASGWEGNRVTVEISGSGGLFLSSMHNVLDEKSLTTATFTTPDKLIGDLVFRLYQKSENVKKGLIIKRFIVRTT